VSESKLVKRLRDDGVVTMPIALDALCFAMDKRFRVRITDSGGKRLDLCPYAVLRPKDTTDLLLFAHVEPFGKPREFLIAGLSDMEIVTHAFEPRGEIVPPSLKGHEIIHAVKAVEIRQ
jgi:hypothetical protein